MTTGPAERHRGDIDGLRAVAVIAVVAFHAGLPGFGGGFVGVDVFFVISGFLITGILLREMGETGSVDLARFWLRRIRRLVPTLALVVGTTCVLAPLALSPLRWGRVVRDAIASLFYGSNVLFASDATRYFDSEQASPLLHTWSLGVEEQFYVLWPAMFALLLFAVRRARRPAAPFIVATIAVLLLASFGASYLLTTMRSPWAYFSLPTRAWQFAAAGLLAVAAPHIRRLSVAIRHVVGAAGLLSIALAVVLLDESTPYPGLAALVPTAGALCVLAASLPGPAGAARALSWAPFQSVGRLAYPWYLWHWPLMIYAGARWGAAGPVLPAAAFVSFLLAVITHHVVENRFRLSPRWTRSGRTVLTVAGVASLLALVSVAGLNAASAIVEDPLVTRVKAARSDYAEFRHSDCKSAGGQLPNGRRLESPRRTCAFGDLESDRTVVLVGDSHAAHWLPALDRAALAEGVRLVALVQNGCPPFEVPVAVVGTALPQGKCDSIRRHNGAAIEALRPSAIVVASASYRKRLLRASGGRVRPEDEEQVWRDGALAFAHRWGSYPLGLILDNPYIPYDPLECILRTRSVLGCEPSASDALEWVGPTRRAEQAAFVGRAAVYDPLPALCRKTCRLEQGSQLIYRDRTHLTTRYSARQAPRLAAFLDELLES